jgi:predicted dehydrogenase
MPAACSSHPNRGLAVIGMGARGCGMSRLICQAAGDLKVAAIADVRPAELVGASLRRHDVPATDDVLIVSDAAELLRQADRFDGLVIATPCHLHAPLAVQAAATGLPLLLEKPVAIDWNQIHALHRAYLGREDQVVVSFPLRLTAHVQTAMQMIRSGRLGTVNQLQAVNNVGYGGVYFGQWYRDYQRTGGLWLQKATHDFDYITLLLGSQPIAVTAMHSRVVYGGDNPGELVCSRCDRTETCPESPANLTARGDDGGTLNFAAPTPQSDHHCCFSSSIRHQDAGSAIIMYADGAHAVYAQNFVARLSASHRGATIIGSDATLVFSWQSPHLRVIDHRRHRVDQLRASGSGDHGGGDQELAANFVDVIRGRALSRSPLGAGLLSAAMCLAARHAANTGVTQPINRPGDDSARATSRINGAAEIEPDLPEQRC